MKKALVVGGIALVFVSAVVAALLNVRTQNREAVADAAVAGANARQGSNLVDLRATRVGKRIEISLTNVSHDVISILPLADYDLSAMFVTENGKTILGVRRQPLQIEGIEKRVLDLQPGQSTNSVWTDDQIRLAGSAPPKGSGSISVLYSAPRWVYDKDTRSQSIESQISRYSNAVPW